ncbi:sulfocyanin-like copper-binding protein [Ferroacidibacillus organovorans]|uniref:Sulfocyanin-like C-terminal domain-containing protein n=1 Tax=Ferroacidibacillus organovorans TaxID=1765683 RepID=A0A162TTJ0_9BACL|nr:sulfocyanin-like copper-binding protein [Ferroacidibacillus organovorans]KYP81116.1 hypothetical protein AYJ22_08515 [Ferroacidibacillus organovorans]OAG92217.1 hypothetical protein AYW79_13270 [Ferroacidibacillus organovorans]OPG16320.1 hypothetical protein B2M26_05390 [Ferroacidibacillus organovorans]
MKQTRKRRLFIGVAMAGAFMLAGCGVVNGNASSILSFNSSAKTVTLNLAGGLNTNNDSMNLDGYSQGQMTVTVPVGYKVKVEFVNDGGIPMDLAVYTMNDQLAFPGAGDSVTAIQGNASAGVIPGQSTSFTFTASQPGNYQLANLLDRVTGHGQFDFGMWAHFNVSSTATQPSITLS